MKYSRTISFFLLGGLLATVFAAEASAQDNQKGEDKILTTKDNWQIHITYFKSDQGKDSPVVILLHNKGGNRLVWNNGFAQKLNREGYAVITVDLRKHGQSVGVGGAAGGTLAANDYKSMVAGDLEAVKKFIYDEHQNGNLNMRKIAIVAPEMSAPIAIAFAELDWLKKPHPDAATLNARTPRGQDIQALVLISPDSTVPGVTRTNQSLKNLRNPLSFLVCIGKKDKLDKRQASRIFKQVSSSKTKERNFMQTYNSNMRGTDLIGKELKTEDHITIFLDKSFQNLTAPQYEWRDRKPKNK